MLRHVQWWAVRKDVDQQREFRVYHHDRAAKTWRHELISYTPAESYVWNMAAGVF